MSKYSEMVGSFSRMGNFPMEANYIFPTETALREFYNDPVNKATLHRGLLKIVEDGGNGKLSLYWVVKSQSGDELKFSKLITDLDINNIGEQLLEILQKTDNIQELLQAVEDLQEDLLELSEHCQNTESQLKTVVGTDQEDLKEYLNTLPYKSLTLVIEALDKLQDFFEGYTDTDTLKDIIEALWNRILGPILPSEEFRTIRGVEDFVRKLAQYLDNRISNLLTEVNLTLIGVGLDSDGLFSPDQETNFLKNATSVMNALRTLDARIAQTAVGVENAYYDKEHESIVFIYKDSAELSIPVADLITEWVVSNETGVVELTRTRVEGDGPDILSADVKLSDRDDNILEKDEKGLLVRGVADNITIDDQNLKNYLDNIVQRLDELEWYENE